MSLLRQEHVGDVGGKMASRVDNVFSLNGKDFAVSRLDVNSIGLKLFVVFETNNSRV